MPLSIEVRQSEKLAVLALAGKMTMGDSVAAVHKAVEDRLAANQKDIVLDMREVTYIDSAGLGGLVTSLTCARKSGGTLRLANVPKRIQDLLDVSSLFMVFQIIELSTTKVDE